MSKNNKNAKKEPIEGVIFLALIVAMLSGCLAMFGYSVYKQEKFNNRVKYHSWNAPKHNRWQTDEMAANVKALQDSTLSADLKHYRDLSDYFSYALLKYSVEKKAADHVQTAMDFMPTNNIDKKQNSRFAKINSMKNGEILDSLDKCVKKLDLRYDALMGKQKSRQR